MVKTTYVVGAGFSRAISAAMPTTDELGAACLERDPTLDYDPGTAAGENFEAWLSRKGSDQPYLGDPDNLANRATFARAIGLISDIMAERQSLAMATQAAPWLLDLVEVWHRTRAAVLTFNYDTLVEVAAQVARLSDEASGNIVPWPTLINFTPPGAEMSFGEMGHEVDWSSFQLLKMHGSLNWYWTPGDASAATLTRARLPGGFGHPAPISESERQRWLPGRSRFLVPPASLKSSYYANPVTREVWQRAHLALRDAERIVMLGYSLPASDISVRGLLRDALASGTALTSLSIVDLSPSPIRERLVELIGDRVSDITLVAGEDSVARFARDEMDALLASARLEVVEALNVVDPESRVAVAWSDAEVAAAISVTSSHDGFVIVLEGIGQTWFATREDRGSRSEIAGHSPVEPLTVARLRDSIERNPKLRVRHPVSGVELPVYGAVLRNYDGVNGGHGTWLLLTCSGRPTEDQPVL